MLLDMTHGLLDIMQHTNTLTLKIHGKGLESSKIDSLLPLLLLKHLCFSGLINLSKHRLSFKWHQDPRFKVWCAQMCFGRL